MSKLIPISKIDPSPWARLFPHDEEHIARLAEDIAERGVQTPLHVYPKGERCELLAGHDRLEALKRNGATEAPCDLRSMLTDEDARFRYFISDNTLRKTVDRRTLARVVIGRFPQQSDRQLAVMVGCDHKTIATVRGEMNERGEIPHVEKRTDSIGREQPATKPERPMAARVEDLRKRETEAPVVTKRDGSIDKLATQRAQREAQADRVPDVRDAKRDELADIARTAWGRVSKFTRGLPVLAAAERFSPDEAREAVAHDPDLMDAETKLALLHEAIGYVLSEIRNNKEAHRASA